MAIEPGVGARGRWAAARRGSAPRAPGPLPMPNSGIMNISSASAGTVWSIAVTASPTWPTPRRRAATIPIGSPSDDRGRDGVEDQDQVMDGQRADLGEQRVAAGSPAARPPRGTPRPPRRRPAVEVGHRVEARHRRPSRRPSSASRSFRQVRGNRSTTARRARITAE